MRRGAIGLVALLVAGCGIVDPDVPDWVANRLPLDACAEGSVDVDAPEALAGQRCLQDAFRTGRGAELITIGELSTGAPLTSYVRVHENSTIEVFLNLGADPSAPGAWERFRCEDLVPADNVRGPAEGVFTLDGCEQLPIP